MEILSIVLLLFVGIFAFSELILVSANRMRLIGVQDSIVKEFLDNPEIYISTILVGTNISIVSFTLVSSVFWEKFNINGVYETIFISFFILIFGETLPKIMGMQLADMLVIPTIYFLKFTYYMLYPFIKITLNISSFILKCVGVDMESKEYIHVGRIEVSLAIKSFIHSKNKNKHSLSSVGEEEMLSNLLSLSSKRVKDIMISIDNVTSLDMNCKREEALEIIEDTGYSRILLYREEKNNIIGYFHIVDLLRTTKNPKNIMITLKWVNGEMPCGLLLERFQRTGEHILGVKDDKNNVIGIVTAEDIVEELVGEIEDEYDVEEEWIEELEDNKWKVRLDAPLWIVNMRTGLPFNRDAYEGSTLEELLEELDDEDGVYFIEGYKIYYDENTPKTKEVIIEVEK